MNKQGQISLKRKLNKSKRKDDERKRTRSEDVRNSRTKLTSLQTNSPMKTCNEASLYYVQFGVKYTQSFFLFVSVMTHTIVYLVF